MVKYNMTTRKVNVRISFKELDKMTSLINDWKERFMAGEISLEDEEKEGFIFVDVQQCVKEKRLLK